MIVHDSRPCCHRVTGPLMRPQPSKRRLDLIPSNIKFRNFFFFSKLQDKKYFVKHGISMWAPATEGGPYVPHLGIPGWA